MLFGKRKSNAIRLSRSQTVATRTVFHVAEVFFGRQLFMLGRETIQCEEPIFTKIKTGSRAEFVFSFEIFNEVATFIVKLEYDYAYDSWGFYECIIKHNETQAKARDAFENFLSGEPGRLVYIDVVYQNGNKRYIVGSSWTDRAELSEAEYMDRSIPGDKLSAAYRARRCK